MPKSVRIYDDLDKLFVSKMQEALLTGDTINTPDWVDDMAAWIAEWINELPKERAGAIAGLRARADRPPRSAEARQLNGG